MKKLVSILMAICFTFTCLSLTACEILDQVGIHVHDYSTEWEKDENKHWYECKGSTCDSIKSEANHNFILYSSIEATPEADGVKVFKCTVCLYEKTETVDYVAPATGAISIHFLTLGNKYSGDCVYIKAGENDILIDAGSRANSVPTIAEYLNNYVTDGTLEYVIVTHADRDHIAGFAASDSIFDRYKCGIIIDFPITEKTTVTYNNYVTKRDNEVLEGAKHFTALECYNESKEGAKKSYELAESVSMNILYNYYYENDSSSENDYSVCVMFTHGEKNFLFTGDLEEKGEEYLVSYNNLPEVELFKAGHHGSTTSTTDTLLSVVKPKICVVTCVAGWREYQTTDDLNQFPSQTFINNISKYTEKVYVTSIGDPEYTNGQDFANMNGNIIITSDETKVTVQCSENDTLLKDTPWFLANRIMPTDWAVQS